LKINKLKMTSVKLRIYQKNLPDVSTLLYLKKKVGKGVG